MATLEGPFTEQLTQPYRPEPVPYELLGHAGTGGAIAHIATKFLEGASQSRMRNFMHQERQRLQGIQALGNLMEMSKSMGLTPAAQSEFMHNVSQEYLKQVANADTGGKGAEKGGNPMTSLFKGIATNLIGGPGLTKAKPIDEQTIGNYFNVLNTLPKSADINKQASELFYTGQNEVRQANPYATETDYIQNPKIAEAFKMLESHGLAEPLTQFRLAIGTAIPAPKSEMEAVTGKLRANYIRDMMGEGQGTGQPPVAGGTGNAPMDSAINRMKTPVNAPVSAEPPVAPQAQAQPQASPYRTLTEDEVRRANVFGGFGKDTRNYMDRTGRVFSGVPYSAVNPFGQAIPQGIYDTGTRQLIHDARETGSVPQKSAERVHTPEEISQFVAKKHKAIDEAKIPGAYKGLLKGNVEDAASDGNFDAANNYVNQAMEAAMRGDISAMNRVQVFNMQQRAKSLGDLSPGQLIEKSRLQRLFKKDIDTYNNAHRYYASAINAYNMAGDPKQKTPGVYDIELMRQTARALHPNQALRETEFKSFDDALGFFNRTGMKLTRGLWDGTKLTPSGRAAFKQMADNAMQEQNTLYLRSYDMMKANADQSDIPVHLIGPVPLPLEAASSEPPPSQQGVRANPGWTPPKGTMLVR